MHTDQKNAALGYYLFSTIFYVESIVDIEQICQYLYTIKKCGLISFMYAYIGEPATVNPVNVVLSLVNFLLTLYSLFIPYLQAITNILYITVDCIF